ncbi:MAG: hypothetical protein J6K50_01600 [Clostridia bacterium]|nr:hypothetical protein [Clostridia bacterium]
MSKKQKKQKEKIVYYDDNSPIADMSSVNRKGEKKAPPAPKIKSTAKEKWQTYWTAVKTMFVPMMIVLGVIGFLYLLMMWLGGNF